jgi:hypothetical protein
MISSFFDPPLSIDPEIIGGESQELFYVAYSLETDSLTKKEVLELPK